MAVATVTHDTRRDVDTAMLRLVVRLVRRSLLLMTFALAAYVVVEVASYLATYPDAAARAQLAQVADTPTFRMMQGAPYAVDTVGGFVVWDGGWALETIVGVWAMLLAVRLLRGEEETERTELVLAAPVRPGRQTGLVLAVVGSGALLIGLVAGVTLAFGSGAWAGSLAFGAALGLFGATFAAIGALASQLVVLRRRASGLAAGVLLASYLLRMVANASDASEWVRWATPYGWVDAVHAFGDISPTALALLVAAPLVLGAVAVRLRSGRDVGAGLLGGADRRTARLHLLGGPTRFAWRETQGVLLAWAVALCAYAFMLGALLRPVVDFMEKDPTYTKLLQSMGMSTGDVASAFVGFMAVTLGLVVAMYVCWRVGAARVEEDTGRLEHLLARPVRRWWWLGGHAVLAAVAALLLTVASGLAMWAGAALTGSDVSLVACLQASFNSLPVVAVTAGLSLLAMGVAPRLTVAVPVTVVVTAYVVELIGSALDWPAWVLDLSPFHHLTYVPSETWNSTAGVVMTAVGFALGALGLLAFQRRDVVGA